MHKYEAERFNFRQYVTIHFKLIGICPFVKHIYQAVLKLFQIGQQKKQYTVDLLKLAGDIYRFTSALHSD